MGSIKYIIFVLLMPVMTSGQTVHVDSDRIVYKGTVKLDDVNKDELFARANHVLSADIKGNERVMITNDNGKEMIMTKGTMRLTSPYSMISIVEYIFELSPDKGGFKYRIDSVYIKETERGGETTKISSGELLKGMDMSGTVAAATEKKLNEIDMKFEKIIDRVITGMKKPAVLKNQQ